MYRETLPLLSTEPSDSNPNRNPNGLNLFATILCIIDVFGVFPVITLTKPIIDCGIFGWILILVLCPIQMYTAVLLGKCWQLAEALYPEFKSDTSIYFVNLNHQPYSKLVQYTYGKIAGKLAGFLLSLTVFCAGVPNLIIASQIFHRLISEIFGTMALSIDISVCFWLIIVTVIISIPNLYLKSPKDMKTVSKLSVGAVLAVCLIICGLALKENSQFENRKKHQDVGKLKLAFWNTIFLTYGIVTFQFDIHPSLLTIQMDMQNKSQISRAILIGFAVTLSMFVITAMTIWIKFPTNKIEASILETLPSNKFLHIAALLVALQLLLTSIIGNNALYQQLESFTNGSTYRRYIIRIFVIIFALLIAELVPRFDVIMAGVGGILTAPLTYIFPPLIYLKLQKATLRNIRIGKVQLSLCILIVIFSGICIVLNSIIVIRTLLGAEDWQRSCLYNSTSKLNKV